MENPTKETKKNAQKSTPVIDVVEDSGFSSIASGCTESFNDEHVGTPLDPESDVAKELQNNKKEEERLKRIQELEQKKLENQEYERVLQEKRYKRLMHLLDKSQFYSNYIIKKLDNSTNSETNNTTTKKRSSSHLTESESIPPKKKKRGPVGKKKDLGLDVSDDMKKKLKGKVNLSQEEIAEALVGSSDEENNDPEENNKSLKEKKFIHPKYFHGTLHKYQQEGLQWLKVLNENGLNGILADEMGLGKTIQAIALICHLIEKKQAGPFLIVAPLSTIPNWLFEFERFAPDLPLVLLHGKSEVRDKAKKKIIRKTAVGDFKTQPIVLTTYEIPVVEKSFLKSQYWRYIIIDEGQRIKNHECLLVKSLKLCKSMNRLLLTGTPLQNNLSELWSLLNFLLPDLFNDLAVFEAWFDAKELEDEEGTKKFLKQEKEKKVMASLREILKPFMLRRVKSEVNLKIPPKKEVIVYAPITELQRDLYKAVLSRDIHSIINKPDNPEILMNASGSRPKRKCVFTQNYNIHHFQSSPYVLPSTSSVEKSKKEDSEVIPANEQKTLDMWKKYTTITDSNMEYLVRMKFQNRTSIYKQICNHPYLVYCPLNWSGEPKIDEDLIKASGKLMVLDKLLEKLKAAGHKILLFSTMTKILDVLEDYLSMRDYIYVRLDGSTSIEDRKDRIEEFNTDSNIFLFLISTRAGGVGLNLASADTVIIFDSDWNPQMDIQAMARCHRIGQIKPVVIYRLCSKGTLDEQIVKRAEAKRKLEKMVISEPNLNLSDKDTLLKLKELLESKDFEIANPDKDIYSEEEFNKLLDRSDLLVQD